MYYFILFFTEPIKTFYLRVRRRNQCTVSSTDQSTDTEWKPCNGYCTNCYQLFVLWYCDRKPYTTIALCKNYQFVGLVKDVGRERWIVNGNCVHGEWVILFKPIVLKWCIVFVISLRRLRGGYSLRYIFFINHVDCLEIWQPLIVGDYIMYIYITRRLDKKYTRIIHTFNDGFGRNPYLK